jgi:hypothetical protein
MGKPRMTETSVSNRGRWYQLNSIMNGAAYAVGERERVDG